MRFSTNRIKAIDSMFEGMNDKGGYNKSNFYFSFGKYHGRWKYLTKSDFIEENMVLKGFSFTSLLAAPFNRPDTDLLNTKPIALSSYYQSVLADLLEYCQTLDTPVLFTHTPVYLTETVAGINNYVSDFVESYGFKVLDMNYKIDEIGLDFEHDLRDANHTNVYGAEKVTDYLCNYIKKNYQLSQHNMDKADNAWQQEYEEFMLRLITRGSEMYNYLIPIKDERYTVFVSSKGGVVNGITPKIQMQLNALGLQTDFAKCRDKVYIATINSGKVTFEEVGNQMLTCSGTLSNKTSYTIVSAGNKCGDTCSIEIDGVQYAINKRGLNFVVYDNDTGRVVDSVCFDTSSESLTASR